MDIFKIELDRAIKKGKLEGFMLKKGKRDKEKIRKYSNYIMEKSHNYDWLSLYFLTYEGEELIDSIINNYDKIEESTYDMYYIIKRICQFPEEKIVIYLDKIIPKLNVYYIYGMLDEIKNKENIINYVINKHITNKNVGVLLAEALITRNIYTDKVYENIDDIIKNNPSELFKLLKTKKLPEKVEEKIKKQVAGSEEYLEETIRSILQDIYQSVYNKEKFKIGEDTIKILVKEICKNENKDYGSIEYIGRGTFSYVIGIGNKVIKIGKKRNTKTFPNNPYIISPLMRETIDIDRDNNIFLEVTEKVETNVQVTDEELYNLYKKLRQIGLVWTDMAERNIGRLTKDNIIHWNTPINPTNESLELEEKRGNIVLKKGSLVILDADHIYDEKSQETKKELLNSKYEKRYQEELESIKRNKFIFIQEPKQEEMKKSKPKVRTLTLPNNNGFINSILIISFIIIISISVAILIIK